MTKFAKTLLVASLLTFPLGFTDVLWGLGLPLGAVLFGLFMIITVLSPAMAQYDRENSCNATAVASPSRESRPRNLRQAQVTP